MGGSRGCVGGPFDFREDGHLRPDHEDGRRPPESSRAVARPCASGAGPSPKGNSRAAGPSQPEKSTDRATGALDGYRFLAGLRPARVRIPWPWPLEPGIGAARSTAFEVGGRARYEPGDGRRFSTYSGPAAH